MQFIYKHQVPFDKMHLTLSVNVKKMIEIFMQDMGDFAKLKN